MQIFGRWRNNACSDGQKNSRRSHVEKHFVAAGPARFGANARENGSDFGVEIFEIGSKRVIYSSTFVDRKRNRYHATIITHARLPGHSRKIQLLRHPTATDERLGVGAAIRPKGNPQNYKTPDLRQAGNAGHSVGAMSFSPKSFFSVSLKGR
jgi:hypothetical protein